MNDENTTPAHFQLSIIHFPLNMTPEAFNHLLQQREKELKRALERTIPVKVGREAKNHFQENFLKGGFVDKGLHPWQRSKRQGTSKGAKGSYKTLLSGRNHLYSSINYRAEPYRVTLTNDVPYARVHNEGLRAGRGKGFTMPRRQFMGESHELTQKITKLIESEIGRILKG